MEDTTLQRAITKEEEPEALNVSIQECEDHDTVTRFLVDLLKGVRAGAPLTTARAVELTGGARRAIELAEHSQERTVKSFLACAENRLRMYIDCCEDYKADAKKHGMDVLLPLPPWDVAILMRTHFLRPLALTAAEWTQATPDNLLAQVPSFPLRRLALMIRARVWTDKGSEGIWRMYYARMQYQVCDVSAPGIVKCKLLTTQNIRCSLCGYESYVTSGHFLAWRVDGHMIQCEGCTLKISNRELEDLRFVEAAMDQELSDVQMLGRMHLLAGCNPEICWSERLQSQNLSDLEKFAGATAMLTMKDEWAWLTHRMVTRRYYQWCKEFYGLRKGRNLLDALAEEGHVSPFAFEPTSPREGTPGGFDGVNETRDVARSATPRVKPSEVEREEVWNLWTLDMNATEKEGIVKVLAVKRLVQRMPECQTPCVWAYLKAQCVASIDDESVIAANEMLEVLPALVDLEAVCEWIIVNAGRLTDEHLETLDQIVPAAQHAYFDWHFLEQAVERTRLGPRDAEAEKDRKDISGKGKTGRRHIFLSKMRLKLGRAVVKKWTTKVRAVTRKRFVHEDDVILGAISCMAHEKMLESDVDIVAWIDEVKARCPDLCERAIAEQAGKIRGYYTEAQAYLEKERLDSGVEMMGRDGAAGRGEAGMDVCEVNPDV